MMDYHPQDIKQPHLNNDHHPSDDDFPPETIDISNNERKTIDRSLLWKIDIRLMPLMYSAP